MAKKKESGIFGLAAAALAGAAASFFLYGPKGHENRKKVKAWSLKAKAEVLEHFEKAKGEITEDKYHAIVDKVTAKYAKAKSVGETEAMKLNAELKKHWSAIRRTAEGKNSRTKK